MKHRRDALLHTPFMSALFGAALISSFPAGAADVGSVVINEVLAWAAEGNDWVEIHNLTDEPISLAGYFLSDRAGQLTKYAFAPEHSLPGHGFLTVECDGDVPASARNTGFGLSRAGEQVFLSCGGQMHDQIAFGPQARGLAVGRLPGQNAVWGATQPTPGAENQAAPLGPVSVLRVNEWMASADRDWFELYNSSDVPVDLHSLYFLDDFGEVPSQPPPLSFVGAGSFVRIWAVGTSANDPDELGF